MKKSINILVLFIYLVVIIIPICVFAEVFTFTLAPGYTVNKQGIKIGSSGERIMNVQINGPFDTSYYRGATIGIYKRNIAGAYKHVSSRYLHYPNNYAYVVPTGAYGAGTYKFCIGARDNTCGWNGNSGSLYAGFYTTYTYLG